MTEQTLSRLMEKMERERSPRVMATLARALRLRLQLLDQSRVAAPSTINR